MMSKGALSPRCWHGGSDALREGGEAWIPTATEAALELSQVIAREGRAFSVFQVSTCAGSSGHSGVPQRAET